MAAQASAAQVLEKPPRTAALGPAAANGKTAVPGESAKPESGHESEEDARWRPVLGLSCELIVGLPVPKFTIADLLMLRPGSVVNAHWRVGHDVPLRLNGTLIAWSELEVLGDRLAVRLTEPA
jgi:flagellar motor switch/type III secretory pathway protein FliN